MSAAEALEQRRKLALLEARLMATGTSSTAAPPAASRAASLSNPVLTLSSDADSSLASADSAPPPPPPRATNPRRNYAPPPPPLLRRDPKSTTAAAALASTSSAATAQSPTVQSAPTVAQSATGTTPALRARVPPQTPAAPRKRRRTSTAASSPGNLRNSRVENYFKPKSREQSKDCPPPSSSRPTRPSTPQPVAVSTFLPTSANSASNVKVDEAEGSATASSPAGTEHLLQNAVKRTLAFVSPAAVRDAVSGERTPPSISAFESPAGSGCEEPGPGCSTLGSADEYRRLRAMIERLTAENKQLSVTAARVKELEAENEDLCTQLEIELPMLREQASAAAAEHEKSTARLRLLESALRESIVAVARADRADARRRVAAMGDRVGRLGVERSGTSLQEVWEEGAEWRGISKKLRDIQAEREAIDKKRRDISRTKAQHLKNDAAKAKASNDEATTDMPPPPLPASASDVPYVCTSAYVLEQEEIYRVQLQVLKREEAQLMEQRARLNRERDVLVRELRRQSDEDVSAFNKFPVINSRYVALNLLGRGGFSEVYKGFDLEQGRYVACKIHQLASNWSEEKKKTFIRHSMREYEIHKSLRHPRVVQLIDIFEIDENTFCTVLEYCDGSDLDSYLRANQTLPEREARSIISQVVSGLVYLSEQRKRIIHYDLKPGNILFHNGEVRIADFGLSKIMNESDATADGMELTSQGAGTMWYLPPECFETSKQARINSKVDVWSAGVILFQMMYGRKPFGHDQTQEKMFREKTVSHQELKFPTKPAVSEVGKSFMSSCLTRKAADRPSVHQLVMHPFLRKR